MPGEWKPDVLGARFEQLTLPLGRDAEGEVVATLVRHRAPRSFAERMRHAFAPPPLAGTDVLYVHGWSDYFFNPELAEFWAAQGARFFALDLRKYGRSLRPGQTAGFVTDLGEYDADIEAALAAMGPARPLVLMGHSTGGLTLSLWAARHQDRVAGLVLNSPWLEFQLSRTGREMIAPVIGLHALMSPRGTMPHVDLGFYTKAVSAKFDGEWDYDLGWRPERGFPTHPAWLAAVLAGHAKVAAGLGIETPVLTLLSARSSIGPAWDESMRTSDGVLVVDEIARRALRLGSTVTVARIDGALHDITLSREPARAAGYAAIARWLRGYA